MVKRTKTMGLDGASKEIVILFSCDILDFGFKILDYKLRNRHFKI